MEGFWSSVRSGDGEAHHKKEALRMGDTHSPRIAGLPHGEG